jgi:hypothetical protein
VKPDILYPGITRGYGGVIQEIQMTDNETTSLVSAGLAALAGQFVGL